jgi:hypothetical protein
MALVVFLLIIFTGLYTTVEAAERGDRDQDDPFYQNSPMYQIIQFLLLLIIVVSIIGIAGFVIVKRDNGDKKSKNSTHLFIPPVSPLSPSQYAFMEKSSCSQCGRFVASDENVCPFCGSNLGTKKSL